MIFEQREQVISPRPNGTTKEEVLAELNKKSSECMQNAKDNLYRTFVARNH